MKKTTDKVDDTTAAELQELREENARLKCIAGSATDQQRYEAHLSLGVATKSVHEIVKLAAALEDGLPEPTQRRAIARIMDLSLSARATLCFWEETLGAGTPHLPDLVPDCIRDAGLQSTV